MKKYILLILALCLSAFIIGCGGSGSESNDPTPTKFTVTGTVQDENGKALKGYKVFLYNQKDADPVENATTNSDGKYTFEDITPGIYKLIAFDSYEFEKISLEDYESFSASGIPLVKDIVVYENTMNKDAVLFNNIVYKSAKSISVFKNTGDTPIKVYGDSRVIINAFGQEQFVKDAEDFNCYVKFDDGSISKIQGVVRGSKWQITKERPVCNGTLTDFSLGDFDVTVKEKKLEYFDGLGTYFGFIISCESKNEMYSPMSFFVSPDYGWFLGYTEDNEVFEMSSID